MCRQLLSYILFFLVSGTIYSQELPDFRFDKIGTENFKVERGLSQNSVNCILQDKKGYIWIGTWDGLNRYDGYSFLTFRPDITNNKGISNQTVYALYQDKDGFIWIGTEGGLNRFDPQKQEFKHYTHNSRNPFSISSDTIWTIYADAAENIWIGTSNGLNLFDKKWEVFYHFKLDPNNANSPSNDFIHCITQNPSGDIIFGTDKGLNVYNVKQKIFSHYYNIPGNSNSISGDKVNSIIYDSRGNLWIGTDKGLDMYNYTEKKLYHFYHNSKDPSSISSNYIKCITEDKEGNIWIGTLNGGVNIFIPDSEKFIHILADIKNPESISNNDINTIMQDRSGNTWIGTAYNGINKADKFSNRFTHIKQRSNDENTLSSSNIWSIFQDTDQKIWLATSNGINILDPLSGKYQYLTHEPDNKNSLPSNQTRYIYKDNEGIFWIATDDAGLCSYNTKTKTFNVFSCDMRNPWSISSNRIWFITQDKQNRLWVGTDNGLNRYDHQNNRFIRYQKTDNGVNSLPDNSISNIFIDNDGLFWLSTYDGVARFDPETEKITTFRHIPGKTNSLSSNKIFSVFEDSKKILWVSTCGGGLNRLDRSKGEIKHYSEKDGLSNNIVYNIFEDKTGNLWISTNYGLTQFVRKTETFINYDAKDGIQSNEFNQNAAFYNKMSGEMFFGGMNGFNVFIPENIIKNTYIPPIVITGFDVFDNKQLSDIDDGDTIRLSYNDNYFSFEFSALDFTNPAKNKYAYFLENFDNRWSYSDAYRRYAAYTNVPPGTYIFRVKGSNSDGTWNEKGISVTIIISPPWWKRWWFRISSVLLIAFIAWYIIYLRLRTINIKHQDEKRILEIEKQMFSLEQTALRLQMNPHFIFNSLNSIQSFIIASDIDKAIAYLAKFSQLMRLILSNSQQTFVPVCDEIKAMSIYLDIEKLRFNDKFSYQFNIDPSIDEEFIEIPPMIIQPYIENAILHGILNKEGLGKIMISMKLKDDKFIECIVEDDGIGRDKAAEIKARSDLAHKSRGMFITQKRLEILNKQNKDQVNVEIIDMKDESGNACGTRIIITIIFKEN